MIGELSLTIRGWDADVVQSDISINKYLYGAYHRPGTMQGPRTTEINMPSLYQKAHSLDWEINISSSTVQYDTA